MRRQRPSGRLGGHRGTGNAVDGGAVGGHDLLGQLFQCSAADALGLLCAFQLAVGNGAVGIHGQGGGDSTAKAFGRAGLSHTGSGGAAAAAAGGQRDANNEAHGHGSAQFADDLLFHGSFLQRKIGLCSAPRKGHTFSRMFTKDNIFCEVLSRDFVTYFVKNDKLVSIVTLTIYEANGRSTLLVIPEWKPSKQFCHFQPQLVLQYYYVLEIGTTI